LKNQRSLHKNMRRRGTTLSNRINQSIILGIPTPSYTDRWRWCTDSCSKEAKHTETQYLTWFSKLPTSTGEVNIIRDIEKGLQHTWRRRITSLKLYSQLSHTAAHGNPSFSLVLFTFSQPSLILLSLSVPIYRQEWCHSSSSSSTKVAANSISFSTMVVAKVNGWCRPFAAH